MAESALISFPKTPSALAGDLPKPVRKRRHAGVAEIQGQLLERDMASIGSFPIVARQDKNI
jgi:hypothetical protein